MDCIEAVEGVLKSVFVKLHEIFVEYRLDDTEYIRNARAVLDATDMFLQNNKLSETPDQLRESLYEFSKGLWLDHLKEARNKEADLKEAGEKDEGYDEYYYDYIYSNGVYPS